MSKDLKILIVDDEERWQTQMSHFLKGKGHKVVVALDPDHLVLDCPADVPFDVILLDGKFDKWAKDLTWDALVPSIKVSTTPGKTRVISISRLDDVEEKMSDVFGQQVVSASKHLFLHEWNVWHAIILGN